MEDEHQQLLETWIELRDSMARANEPFVAAPIGRPAQIDTPWIVAIDRMTKLSLARPFTTSPFALDGEVAARGGVAKRLNPYESESDAWHEWLEGWDRAGGPRQPNG